MSPRPSLLRALTRLHPQTPPSSLPPYFLLPFRAALATSTTPTTTTSTDPSPPPLSYKQTPSPNPPPAPSPSTPSSPTTTSATTPPHSEHPKTISRHFPLPPPTNPPNTTTHLPLLAAQPPHYILTHIHSRPYLLTTGDLLRLPFLLPNAPIGTVLRLNRASMLGSRDYTYRGDPWVDENKFLVRAVLVGVEGEKMRVHVVKRRRDRRVRTTKGKGRFSLLRVREIRVLVEGEGGEKETLGGEEAVGEGNARPTPKARSTTREAEAKK